MINQKSIKEFEKGDKIDGFYLVRFAEKKTATNGKEYMDFTLADKTGEISAKLWAIPSEDSVQIGDCMVLKFRGSVNEWKDQLQFRIEKLRNISDDDGVKTEDFIKSAPIPAEEMLSIIGEYISKIKDEEIKNLVGIIIKKNKRKLTYYPAAKKNHHAVRSGLLYHIYTMLKAGEKLMEVYDNIKPDFLYAGIILHDIGKIREMESGELGIVTGYSMEGKLIGHLVYGANLIEKEAEAMKMTREKSIILQHMILSHHFNPEFGSPKYPLTAEAELLHLLDLMDSRLYDIKNALEGIEEGTFTEGIWSLDKRQFYNPKI
jgi:3'-5' exoribonuclease